MYTEQIKRRKSNAFFQMKTITASTQKDKVIQKLGSSIYASMDRLKSLKAQIMTAKINNLKPLILEFQKQHTSFMDKQKSLMEIQENSDKIERLKTRVKQFLQTFSATEIQKKIQSMKQDHVRQSHRQINAGRQQQVQVQKQQGESFRKRLLDEQDLELKQIQKMMAVIKKITIDTSELVVGIGAKLNIASQSMRQARIKMQQARKQLVQTNQYQQDSSKMRIFLCALVTVILIVIFLIIKAANKT